MEKITDAQEIKYKEMQKYVPFIHRVIEKLKLNNDHETDNPRKAQLQKMEMLHDLLTNKQKKIKIGTLMRCEAVLKKLQAKIEKSDDVILSDIKLKQLTVSTPGTSALSKNVESEDVLGPASPPPEIIIDEDVEQPVVIPTERCSSPVTVEKVINSSVNKLTQHKTELSKTCRQEYSEHSTSEDFNKLRKKVFNSDYKDGKNTQTGKVAIANTLPAYHKMQHFAGSSNYLSRTPVCQTNSSGTPATAPIFSCLGSKVSENSAASIVSNKTCGRYTPIPDVLKSPPLTVSDINNLLLESGSDKVLNDISEIGSRRPPKEKNDDNKKESPINSFEFVRKKLAQTAKMSSPRTEATILPTERDGRNKSPTSKERVALKYNPHPRQERLQSISSTDGSECSIQSKLSDPRVKSKLHAVSFQQYPTQIPVSNVNVLPAINLSDPRLKKQNMLLTTPTPPSLTSTSSMSYRNQSPITYGGRHDPRIPRMANNTVHSMPGPTTLTTTNHIQYSSEENWDSDEDEKEKTRPAMKTYAAPSRKEKHNSAKGSQSDNRSITSKERDNFNQPHFQTNFPVDKVPIIGSEKEASIGKIRTSYNSNASQVPRNEKSYNKNVIQKETANIKNKLAFNTSFEIPKNRRTDAEEDWDSQPEPLNVQKKTLKTDEKKTSVVASYNSQISRGLTQHPNVGKHINPSHRIQHSSPSPSNRFNSVLNDKSERIKYLEAKKQKNEPQTYKEFREAKERALAQEAAIKRAAEEVERKRSDELKEFAKQKDMREVINDKKETKNEDTIKKLEESKKGKKAHHKDNKNTSAVESTLDKMYRTQNFNAAFPKTNTSFKIPKKKMDEKSNETDVAKSKEATKEDPPNTVLANVIEENKIKLNQAEPLTDNIKSKDIEANGVKQLKPNMSAKSEQKAEIVPITVNACANVTEKQVCASHSKVDSTKEKPFNDNNNNNNNNKPAADISSSKVTAKEKKEMHETKHVKETEDRSCYENTLSKSVADDEIINIRDPRSKLKSTLARPEDFKENEKDVQELRMLGDIMITSAESQVILKPQQNLDKFNKLTEEFISKPQRILRRRNTMVAFDSAPLVDKDKLKRANALLFEDVQEEAKRKQKQAEEDRITARRNKNLEEMFKKTDDNCTVSTQNIITGKRRTRPTINFNEIANAKNVFKHKTAKDTSSACLTSTVQAAQPSKTIRSNFRIKLKNLAATEPKDEDTEDEESLEPLAKIKDSLKENKLVKSAKTKSFKENKLSESETEVKLNKKLVKKQTKKTANDDKSCLVSKNNTKPNEEEYQICAVSSTSTDNCTNEPTPCSSASSHKPFKSEVDDNEPTSTASKSSNPTINEIVDQILTPNANREHILGVLSQILSDDKLELIKSLMLSNSKQMERQQLILNAKVPKEIATDESISVAKCNSNSEDADSTVEHNENVEPAQRDHKAIKSTTTDIGKKMTGPKKKRTELDRLNEDIRDMFICNGVITATGRRMCTMMGKDVPSAGSRKSSKESTPTPMIEDESKNKKKEEMRKALAVSRTLRRSVRSSKAIDDNEDNESTLSLNTDESVDEFNATTNNSSAIADVTTGQRKMPVLKPHTPVKISEDDMVSCKMPNTKEVVVKRKSNSKCNTKMKKFKKSITSELEEKESEKEVELVEQEDNSDKLTCVNSKNATTIKNTNIHWHNQSKYITWCMICDKKILAISSSLHYKTHHRENYISRMAPVLLQQFKQSKLNKPLFGVKRLQKQPSWFYRCPFCLKYFNAPISLWLEHFQNHTVEFRYECSKCHRTSNRKMTIVRHIKMCDGASIVNSPLKLNTPTVINAHVCHLCNFIQLKRENLDRHYIEQHHLMKNTAVLLGYTVKLLDIENVECVSKINAAEREIDAWKCIEKDEQVIDIIDDDETTLATPGNNFVTAENTAKTAENKNQEHSNNVNAKEQQSNPYENNDTEVTIESKVLNVEDHSKPDSKIEEEEKVQIDDWKAGEFRSANHKAIKLQNEEGCRLDSPKISSPEQTISIANNNLNNTTLKSKKNKTATLLDVNKSQSKDFEVINEKETVQNIQDELLLLAAKAAEEEVEKNANTNNNFDESQQRVLSDHEEPQTTESCVKMSDIISKSVAQIYNQHCDSSGNKQASTDADLAKPAEKLCPATSNVFMPTRDENNYSPTIQILAQSIINIDEQGNDGVKDKPITMAERLSQRFKELQSENATFEKNVITSRNSATNEISNGNAFEKLVDNTLCELTKEKDIVTSNQATTTTRTAQSKNNAFERLFNETALELEADNKNDNVGQTMEIEDTTQTAAITVISDDEDWEDIEITESAPTVSTINTINTQKSKNKGLFQKFGIYKTNGTKSKKHLTPMLFLPKKKTKEKPPQSTTLIPSPNAILTAVVSKVSEIPNNNSLSNSNAHIGFKPLGNIMDGLFPDSPCNDPIDLVPELAPLEPLQDLNDISSILDSNLGAVNISAADNHTSIEDALDFISEQQANDKQKSNGLNLPVMPNQATKATINNICHVAFSVHSAEENSFKFYCLLQNCSFLFSSDPMGLETHFMCEHSQIKWNGYCLMCQSQCFPNSDEYSISKEIRHMMEKHANKSTALDLNTDSTQHSSASSHDDERPKIKLRRLTGDCLSRSTPDHIDSCNEVGENVAAPRLSMLGALLVADPKPPTKDMPPQPQMPLTEPLLIDKSRDTSSQLTFTNVNSDFLITSVTSANPNQNKTPLQITNVISLNSKAAPPTHNLVSEEIQIPKISNVRTLAPKTGNRAFPQHVQEERVEPTDESLEVMQILQNAERASTNRELLRSGNDSPVIVAETVPLAQSKTGDFIVTQTVSAQYNEFSSTALGFNISIASSSELDAKNTHSETMSSSSAAVASRQYKCMGSGCKFVSRVPVAMSDHLRFHERRNLSNKHDYLICGFCFYCAADIPDYMKHANKYHITNKGGNTGPNIANNTKDLDTATSLTKKIQSILNSSSDTIGANRFSTQSQTTQVQDTQEVYLKKLRDTIDEIVGPTGLADDKLYRCVIKNCPSQLAEGTYLSHIMFHIATTGANPNNHIYKCPHCTAQYHRAAGIKAHIKNHARNRYFCYLCDETSTNPGQLLKHFSEKHWHTLNMYTKELLPPKVSNNGTDSLIDSSYYVAYTQDLSPEEVRKFGEKLILEWQRKKFGSKTHFKSSEIDLLPLSAIFQRQVNCGECEYKTKVRTNMFRHLLMHKQNPGMANKSGDAKVCSVVDPINPVPCLNSSERFFDKMTNLASSSLVPSNSGSSTTKSSFKLPQAFVEEQKRYVCGCQGCNYHTISEDLFRTHLSTLHGTANSYCCTFCKEEICKRGITIDRIMNHTRFHGTTIYRCEECNYVHHLRYVVERHINEKHATMKVNIIVHNRSVEDSIEGNTTTVPYAGKKYKENIQSSENAPTSHAATRSTNSESAGPKPMSPYANNTKSKGKWICDMCGHKTYTVGQMQAHCQHQHNIKSQYKCAHCIFGSQQLSQILHHIDEKHSGKTREARCMYHKNVNIGEEVADTRPLWQRNDPTRVRHIRGILMEDEEESEEYRKRMGLAEDVDDDSNEDVQLEAEENYDNTNRKSYISGYEFSCYHCSFKTQSFDDLKNRHYKQIHNSQLEIAKPFWYRLQRVLCCPECRSFVGNFSELQHHLQSTHKKMRYCAADVRTAENDDTAQRLLCGYCSFHCANTEHLYRHHIRVQHCPQDIRIDNDEHIMEIVALGKAEISYQCTLCRDIFCNRVAIVEHACNVHPGEDSFSFRELSNSLIYRCSSCCFTSTTEAELLRHTIDHYNRFRVCNFCKKPQSSFNVYMQHCYAEHKDDIQKFRTIYPLGDIKRYLLQVLIIFPSGLVLNKKNLLNTKYGKTCVIEDIYEEIYKTSQQPPIPRLSIARLVARKSIEAQQKHVEYFPNRQDEIFNAMHARPKSISKRRCTVALSLDGNANSSNSSNKSKNTIVEGKPLAATVKRRTTIDNDQQQQQQHQKTNEFNVPLNYSKKISSRRSTVAVDRETLFSNNFMSSSTNSLLCEIEKGRKKRKSSYTHSYTPSPKLLKEEYSLNLDMEPFSFYGQTPEELDLSKVYTKVAIGGIKTPLSIEKFKLLFNMDCQLKLKKCDEGSDLLTYNNYKHIKKACPASEKQKHN